MIFNHKNAWANCQNPNPASIYYELHNENRWHPLVFDPLLSDREDEEEKAFNETGEESDTNQGAGAYLLGNFRKNKGNSKKKMEEAKYQSMGAYMKPFQSFYQEPRCLTKKFTPTILKNMHEQIMRVLEAGV